MSIECVCSTAPFDLLIFFRIVRVQLVHNSIFRITIGKRPKLNPSEHLHPVSKLLFHRVFSDTLLLVCSWSVNLFGIRVYDSRRRDLSGILSTVTLLKINSNRPSDSGLYHGTFNQKQDEKSYDDADSFTTASPLSVLFSLN